MGILKNTKAFKKKDFFEYLIQRDVLSHQAPERVNEGRQDDSFRGIDVAVHLRTRVSEIKNWKKQNRKSY